MDKVMIDVKWQDHTTADPAVMVGKPIIKGTRITVELIVEKLGYSETVDEILEDYPHLSREQIYACGLPLILCIANEAAN